MIVSYDVFRTKSANEIIESWICNEKLGQDITRRLYYKLRVVRNENSIGKLGYPLIGIIYDYSKIIYKYKFVQNLKSADSFNRYWIEYNAAISKKCKFCHFRHIKFNWCMIKNKEINKDLHFKCAYWNEMSLSNNLEEMQFVHQSKRSKINGGANSGVFTYKGL